MSGGLRCRPGDLAVVVSVHSVPELLGRLVLVERRYVPGEKVAGYVWSSAGDGADWVIKSASGDLLPSADSSGVRVYVTERPYPDLALRPIRPNDGEDESLSWSRTHVEETA